MMHVGEALGANIPKWRLRVPHPATGGRTFRPSDDLQGTW